jgi:proteic killer suppression protein
MAHVRLVEGSTSEGRMIRSFRNRGTEDLFNGVDSKVARKVCPIGLWKGARRRLSQLDYAATLEDLRLPSSNRLHGLKGDREGQHSISINMEYRICFRWTPAGPEEVEIADYH